MRAKVQERKGQERQVSSGNTRTVIFDQVVHLLATAALEGVGKATLAAAEARAGRVAHGTHEQEQQQPASHPCTWSPLIGFWNQFDNRNRIS